MDTWQFALWGFFGGLITEGLDFYRYAKRGRVPKAYFTWPFVCAEILRLGAGAILAVAFGSTNQVTGLVGLLVVGAATPLLMERLVKDIQLTPGTKGDK